ncbi:MAG: hypothetical protein AAGJ40_09770 [Planctomycetota bacterium]
MSDLDPSGGDRMESIQTGRSPSQFPQRWSPIKGSYTGSDYTPRGRFGAREAGSTLAFSAAIQPAIIYASYQIEQMAEAANPSMDSYGAIGVFGAAWGGQFIVALIFKVLAGFVRNFGESLIRDLGSWFWSHMLHAMWGTFVDTFFGWLPWRRRRPNPIWDHEDRQPIDDEPRRQPVRDWWRKRRERVK